MEALTYIGEKNILSPLLVLEILGSKRGLKFKVVKLFLKLKLEKQTAEIDKNNKKVQK